MRDDCCRSGRDMMMVAVRWNRLSVWPNDGCQLKHFTQARVVPSLVLSLVFFSERVFVRQNTTPEN